jgi:hypothetical protein
LGGGGGGGGGGGLAAQATATAENANNLSTIESQIALNVQQNNQEMDAAAANTSRVKTSRAVNSKRSMAVGKSGPKGSIAPMSNTR